ncbi:hypothetical protein C2G38_2152898 [Gigaspora rosea]|uniref:Uncharacterized protein n=1 Tax=Gigaspora rosea TaxID=44941 RepID=A0A397W9E6_9GLOM|nr:hypothetical protein C2G38_2152898 [Gigaspora rosea]
MKVSEFGLDGKITCVTTDNRIKFFTGSLKQSECLDEAQQQIQSNVDSTNVSNSDDSDSNGSYKWSKTKKLLLLPHEWDLLKLLALKYTFAEFEIASDILNKEQESSDDDSKDLEYDIFEPLSHLDTVITTNPADGSSQNFLIIRSMCHIIYNSLFDYWDKLMNGLLASLLDSQLKTLLTGMKKLVKELKKN